MVSVTKGPEIDLGEIYTPHEGQRAVHESKAKVKVLEWGRRVGKSRCAEFDLIATYLNALNMEVPKGLVPPFHSWIVAPSYPQARQVWTELRAFLPEQFVYNAKEDERILYLRGSEKRKWAMIEVKSAYDADTLQTVGLDFLWVTEAQDVADKAFYKLLPTLRSPSRLSRAVFEGIPAMWAEHWFWKMCATAAADETGHYYYSKLTYQQNPMLSESDLADIEADRELLPEAVWRRMYLAERSEEAGYFKGIDKATAGDILAVPVPGARYVAGIDLGRKVDPSVLTVLDASSRSVVYNYQWDQGTDWPVQREHLRRLYREWQFSRLIVDATGMGGDIFTQEIIEAGIPAEPFVISTAAVRHNLLQDLAVALERGTVQFPKIPGLLRELRAFQYRKMPGGGVRVEAPPGEHDDQVFALALGLQAADPAQPVVAMSSLGSQRYLPSQTEADNGGLPSSFGARFMRERRLRRWEERYGHGI